MENFFLDDKFCSDLGDLCHHLDLDDDAIAALPDDWFVEVVESSLEPVVKLSADWIVNKVNDDRWTEDGNEVGKVYKALELIDFDKVNAAMPTLYYESRPLKKFKIKKADLLD